MLEKTPGSPMKSKEIKPVNSKGNQPGIFVGRTDAKAEAPVLWPPDAKSQLIRKDPDAGKIKGGKFSSVQSLSRVQLFVTPWTAVRQASLSITNSWSLQTHVL